tara:strand:- start:146 stop:787 length:642 start_codon:yes stop_codon:yes gene_type:complete
MKSPLGLLEFQEAIRGGVRPNLFSVQHAWPTDGTAAGKLIAPVVQGANMNADRSVTYLCKSAALPATNVGTVELPFRGRVVKVPGDRTFETWTATFYMDDTFALRGAYEKWIQLTNGVDTNTAVADISDTFKDVTISQLDKFGGPSAAGGGAGNDYNVIRQYRLVAAFPVSVSQVSVAYDNNDSYEEFDVEFAYQYHESLGLINDVSKDSDKG